VNVHAFVTDARGPDPTGTAGIRRSFRAAGKLRLRMFRSQMRQAVLEHDVLGLGGGGLALQPAETRLKAFQGWASTAAEQTLQGPWLSQWIARAWASGEAVGAMQTRSQAPGEGSGAWAALAKIELDAISFAVVQTLTREAATALTKRRANKTVTWHKMGRAFDKVGPKRIMALANTFCVACHNRGRLAAYRAAGITKVGVIAEQLLPKQALLLPGGLDHRAVHDAKTFRYATGKRLEELKAQNLHKGYKERRPARPEYTLSEVEEPIEVGVRTAGDEFVCIECDEFAARSPHDIDDVEDTLPIHPNCRCTWFPWDDRRFRHDEAVDDAKRKKTEREELLEKLGRKRHRLLASLVPRTFKNRFLPEDAWNPNQPREPAGTSEGGQFASAGGGGGGKTGKASEEAKAKYFKKSVDLAHHQSRVKQLLSKQAGAHANYRWQVSRFIEEAAEHGQSTAPLKAKLGESFWRQGVALVKKGGDKDKAQKLYAKAAQLGYEPDPGTTPAQAEATAAAPPEPTSTFGSIPIKTAEWEKIGIQKGSVSGGIYSDPHGGVGGGAWYIKTPKTEAHVNADLLSNALYKMAGVAVSEEAKTILEGKFAVASKLISNTKTLAQASDLQKQAAHQALREGFAVDVWLGNRDVIGEGFDNVLVQGFQTYRIDQGGTLMYRAQGETKEFGPEPNEISTMRMNSINAQTASVFATITDAELSASIDKVLAIPDSHIKNAVVAHGFGNQLANTLIDRKAWLAEYQKKLNVPGASPTPPPPAPAPAQAAQPKPTAAELEKAKKVGPFYPAPTSEMGKAAVKAFNEKWATKVPEPHELEQKVAEYKGAKATLEMVQQQEMSAAEKAQAELKKQQAAATKAAKAAAEAKAQAEKAAYQEHIAKIASEIGLDPSDAAQVDTLISLAGGDTGKIVQQFKQFYETGKGKHGLPVTPFEAAMIQSYVGPHAYDANAKLRSGYWDMRTHVFANAIQKGLSKLPAYHATVKRGFTTSTEDQGNYVPGKIVFWHAFSSCGKQNSFGGNMQCIITPLPGSETRAKDLGPFNPTETGGEVLYMAHSAFKVTKVEGKPGGTMHVWLEEVETIK
jgi:hypothetical protein